MAALAVVADLEVLEDGVGQLNPSPPAFPVEDLDLESRPEGLDYGVVETVADRAHRWQQSRLAGSPGERPGHELHSLVRVDDQPGAGFGLPVRDGHPERIGDQCRSLGRVDRPADNASAECVEHDTTVELAFAGPVFGDVGDPELIRFAAVKVPIDEI